MKKLTKKVMVEILNTNGYHNDYELGNIKKGSPVITYYKNPSGRAGWGSYSHASIKVIGMRFKGSTWQENGSKWIAGKKDVAIAEAIEIVKKLNVIPEGDELIKSPFDGYVLKSCLDFALENVNPNKDKEI